MPSGKAFLKKRAGSKKYETGLVLILHRFDDMSQGALAGTKTENVGTHLQWSVGYLF